MNIIKVEDYEEMGSVAADYVSKKIQENPEMTLGLATGSTPKSTYKHLIEAHQKGTSFKHITTFNLDEYVGLKPNDPNSYHFYMNEFFFQHTDIPSEKTHLPNGHSRNIGQECEEYEKKIKGHTIDLQILGIGANGHIGFNEPGTSFESKTHVVKLTDSTRKANARFFSSLEEVPTHAITMGIASIMSSKEIVLLVSGEAKSEALERLLSVEEPNESFPASILKSHPHVTIIADKEALMGTGIKL
jgi:glucosamine-6-phosphate deaminase